MNEFLKNFLHTAPQDGGSEKGPQALLAAFGKHPGWNDFFAVGLDTPSLVLVKEMMYDGGIGGQIDAGGWKKLEGGARLPGFRHVFLWDRGGREFLLGRLWDSSDGKGRHLYPMCLCAHVIGCGPEEALRMVMSRLAETERLCREEEAVTSASVKSLLSDAAKNLRKGLARSLAEASEEGRDETGLEDFLDHSDMGPEREGFVRMLHLLRPAAAGACAVRAPACVAAPGGSLLRWRRFLQGQLRRDTPLLLLRHVEQDWLDVLAGEPVEEEFFRLGAGLGAVPLDTTADAGRDGEITEKFRQRARRILESYLKSDATPESALESGIGRLFSGLFGGRI